ncbi:hypothetical protein L596_013877 [Steinernema carpocapsae]|uniref:TIL domain-containing protein n=1 Tax=Steinernema carpocapsae TaxID=34508 RepID=A0A4U5P2V2_STECR|nr:hypothetical protein L596_013877 [Steinernema carpocapsae]
MKLLWMTLLLAITATVVFSQTKKCDGLEEWMDCGSCEGSCKDRAPICTTECKTSGCYCPTTKNFVRLADGSCKPAYQCLPGVKSNSMRKRHLTFML